MQYYNIMFGRIYSYQYIISYYIVISRLNHTAQFSSGPVVGRWNPSTCEARTALSRASLCARRRVIIFERSTRALRSSDSVAARRETEKRCKNKSNSLASIPHGLIDKPLNRRDGRANIYILLETLCRTDPNSISIIWRK